jgi:hypothetical protein
MAKLNGATNTQSEKHTPLPYRSAGHSISAENYGRNAIASLHGDNAANNTAFIVEAVNQHYGLKAENQKLRAMLESQIEATKQCMDNKYNCQEVIDTAAWVTASNEKALSGDK